MTRTLLIATIVVVTLLVALLDFFTSAALVGSILFTFPIALCATQRSKRLLWGTAAAAGVLTIAAEFWGFNRAPLLNPWVDSANRCLLIASLLTLTAFIHFWMKKSQELVLNASDIKRQSNSLVAQNEQLTILVAAVDERTKELGHANQDLERSNIELKQFAYIASHDLQSPLRNISGFVQLLKLEYEGKLDEQAQDWIRRTVQSIGQMQTLIRDLLSYSRVDARARPFAQVPFLDIVNDALALLESSIRDSGGQVTCGQFPTIMGDRSQLVQLIQNLVGNGLTYHGDKPPYIHLSAERTGEEWIFSVRDNGIGIDPKHCAQIFEIFKRLHDQAEYPGTGIGLAVCRRVVGRHGGRIWVKSEPGHGSTFYFTIPDRKEQTNA